MTFEFSGSLLRYVGYQRRLELGATNMGAALEALCGRHPDLKKILFGKDGRISRAHQIFLNGDRIAHENHQAASELLQMPLQDADTVSILTLITGG
jgi:molybdopterin converting factor small subunit